MAGFILSNVTGLVRQILVTRTFGTAAEIDAFNAAARLPETLFLLVAGGALASAFIPTFMGFLEKEDREGAWHLASVILNLVSLILVIVSGIIAVIAPQVVRYVLAPYFDPGQQVLTVSLLRVLLISPTIFGVSGLLMGILNTHQHFLLPAIAPTLHWIGWIIGVLLFVPILGIHGMAWGAVLGAGLHLGVQLPGFSKLGGRYLPTLGLRFPAVREVAGLMGPRLIGVAVVQLNFWVNTILASSQPEGSLTAIGVAWAVMTMPQVVIAQSIAIAALPTFSAQVARGKLAEMRSSLAATLRGVVLLSLPATLGLIMLRRPIVVLLFQRGAFDAHSTDLVAWALLWYGMGLLAHSILEIISRAFYALHDTRTPVIVGVVAMSLNVVFSISFAAWFERIGWAPHGGLALGNTLATALEVLVLLVMMRRRLNGLEGHHVLSGVRQSAAAALMMSMAVWIWLGAVGNQSVWIAAFGSVIVGGLIYALVVLGLQVEEAWELIRVVRARLRKNVSG